MGTMTMAVNGMEPMDASSAEFRHSIRSRSLSVADRNQELFEAQRSRRRGPTPEMYFSKRIDNSRLVKADDPQRRQEMRRFSVAMFFLFAFTMVYVWQHLASIEMGYSVEARKHDLETMREANRQLRLNEAELSDPQRIDAIAKQLGLTAPAPGQVVRPDGLVDANAPVVAQMHPVSLVQ